MAAQEIPIASLNMTSDENVKHSSESILENEIEGIQIEHVFISAENRITDHFEVGIKTIYLFLKGKGTVQAVNNNYELVPESILLPNAIKNVTIIASENSSLHYLKISCKLTEEDLIDLQEFPAANIQSIYFKKFDDCQSYTEPIKSPNTISRTILPNKYIPRIAMGTVQTTGPDEVGAHEHPMLEQLFLGLSNNNCVVYADDTKVIFPQYALLHIPLGSKHSISVVEGETLYYIWMDFFLDKKGEEWLKTHIVDKDN